MRQVVVWCVAASENQSLAIHHIAIEVVVQVQGDHISSTAVVRIGKSFAGDGNELALIVRCARGFGKPFHLSRP